MKSLLFALLVTPMGLAGPTTKASRLALRDPGNVKICTESEFTGTCTDIFVGIGTSWPANCQPLQAPYNEIIGSVQPDRGALCRLFDEEHPTCTGSGLAIIEYPGKPDLYDAADTGHLARYISCVTCTACQG